MKYFLAAILPCFMAIRIFATEQIPDRLVVNGKTYDIGSYTYIMEEYFSANDIPNPQIASSALNRGYIAELEIVDGKLLCKRFFNYKYDDNHKRHENNLNILKDGKPVFCEWFSGKDIKLKERREMPYWHMLEENLYVLDVKNGMAEIRLVRHIPEKRFSLADLDRREGVEYDPQKDNPDSWMELQHTILGDYQRFSLSTTLDIIKKVLGTERVKTRCILQYTHRGIASLYLPETRSSAAERRSIKTGALDTQKYAGKAVEIEIKSPMTIDAEIVGIRELEKSESIHNQCDGGIFPRGYEAQNSFDAEAEKLYPIIGAESADFDGMQTVFCADRGSFHLRISNIKDESNPRKADHTGYISLDGTGEFDILERIHAKKTAGHTFMLDAVFNSVNTPKREFSKLENWEYPKKVSLAGKPIWDFHKENNKVFKFITDKSNSFDVREMSDLDALKALEVLANMNADDTESGAKKMEAISERVSGIDFKQHQRFAHLLSWAINFKVDKKHLYMYADKLADFCGKEVPFNREFIDSEDFKNDAIRSEASSKSYRILCDSYRKE